MKVSDFKVGQKLCYVQFGHRRNEKPQVLEHVVIKVGRQWVTACEPCMEGKPWMAERFKPETMTADGNGYASPGKYYLTEEQYRSEIESNKAWRELQEFVQCGSRVCKTKLSAQRIREILNELKGNELMEDDNEAI